MSKKNQDRLIHRKIVGPLARHLDLLTCGHKVFHGSEEKRKTRRCIECENNRFRATEEAKPKETTHIVEWKGGIEVSKKTNDKNTQPPWYVIHMSGGYWDDKGWYYWHDYLGPPVVFLTRKRAAEKASRLRKQHPKAKVRVQRIDP